MDRRSLSAAVAVLASLALAVPAAADSRDPINAYRVKATRKNLEQLALAGFDVTEGRRAGKVEVFGTAGQLRKFGGDTGVAADGRAAAFSAGSGAAAPVHRLGCAVQGLAALRPRAGRRQGAVPRAVRPPGAAAASSSAWTSATRYWAATSSRSRSLAARRRRTTTARPAVLYNAMQHAREWLAGETCRRTLTVLRRQLRQRSARVTRLVDTRELWFVCVANPDGYEYTFTPGNRLWRKNMADNDGDGVRGEINDGVDPNRNFPVNWGLDDEGSSPDPTSETYRGPSRTAPEPETQAMLRLWRPRRLRVPEERPHRGRAAPVSAGLAAVHADRRRPDLHGARR